MRRVLSVFVLACVAQAVFPGLIRAQQPATAPPLMAWRAAQPADSTPPPLNAFASSDGNDASPSLVNITPLPRMAPELALATYERRLEQQPMELAGYSATQVVDAYLLDTHQKGEWELERRYVAPKTLEFKPGKFQGDGFIKTNVIARLLKSEVEHIQNDDPAATALTPANYKVKYQGLDTVGGEPVHVFEIKPHQKRPGLIKGRIYLDVHTGALRRVSGELAKSPSFFIKKLEFVQDYADFGGFTLPVLVTSDVKTRIVGRAHVEISTRAYTPVAAVQNASAPAPQPGAIVAGRATN